MDPEFKKKRETIAEILQIAKKQPYPSKDAVHLARFIDSCFAVIHEKKKEELKWKEEENKRRHVEALKRIEEEKRKKKEAELEAMAPSPEGMEAPPELEAPNPEEIPAPQGELAPPDAVLAAPGEPPAASLGKREYAINMYNAPVGVLVDQEEGKYEYKIIEPAVDPRLIEMARKLFGKSLRRDNSLFDNANFMNKVAERTAVKSRMKFNPIIVPGLRYYLERDLIGGGKLDPILYDNKVKKVIVEGPGKNIKVDYADLGEMPTNVMFDSKEEINKILKRVANATGKLLDENNPMLNVTFQGLHFTGVIGEEQSKFEVRRVEDDL